MIDSALSAGCLSEVLRDVWKQNVRDKKFERWLAHGHGKSYQQFWGEEYYG